MQAGGYPAGGGEAAAALLNFEGGWDKAKVQMLDSVVQSMYSGDQNSRQGAHDLLTQLKAAPEAWRIVDTVLASSESPDTKFFCLNILENVIQQRWKVLSEEHRNGIRAYVVMLINRLASDEETAKSQKHFLTKLNETLICIVKQEWPHSWANFIPEICAASQNNQSMCENTMRILNLLSEEVFDFGKNSMTTKKVMQLKQSLNQHFKTIFELCWFIFNNHRQHPGSVKATLLTQTLTTLSHFLMWIPLGFIFETELIQVLLGNFWDPLEFRIGCVKCLNEIACLHEGVGQYQPQLVQCFAGLIQKINEIPPEVFEFEKIPAANRVYWEVLLNQLALLFTGFLRHNLNAMEQTPDLMVAALQLLTKISTLPNEETFKICLEFWHIFAAKLYVDSQASQQAAQGSLGQGPLMLTLTTGGGMTENITGAALGEQEIVQKKQLYEETLVRVRQIFISRMAKPPEVTIKENEEGHIVRQEEEDTDEIALYKYMREVLIYLTNLGPESMERIMMERLSSEVVSTPEKWSPTNLNRLCWAIGSISGAMAESEEKKFLVCVIKDLLSLCEMKRGKENKAVVASNIMYVVGQYPRFLKAHWKFLKTVVHKLFEFMHEPFPGVQEMSVDTFLKISQKCKKKFVVVHPGEDRPFINELFDHIQQDTADLEHLHICTYYEAVGYMISAATSEERQNYVSVLMVQLSQEWCQILDQAQANQAILRDNKVMKRLSLVLRCHERVCAACGAAVVSQLQKIYVQMLMVYKNYSDSILASCKQAEQNGHPMRAALGNAEVRLMRNVKRDILRLVCTFIDKSTDEGPHVKQQLAEHFVPPLIEMVMTDYRTSAIPDARDAEVLDLVSVIASKLSEAIAAIFPQIFLSVFECTLDMIKHDFQSFPDHRQKFYGLMKSMNASCFQSLLQLPPAQLQLFVDSLAWAFKHQDPAVADLGLQILSDFIDKILAGPEEVFKAFFKQYYFQLIQDVLGALTDTMHKSGFKLQCKILLQLITAANSGRLGEVASKQAVMEHLCTLFTKGFETVNRTQLEAVILNMFNKSDNWPEFVQVIRDFLISLKEFAGEDASLYEPERQEAIETSKKKEQETRTAVPGLVPQYDPARLADDMDD